MDLRTLYLQQLLQVSDLLVMQRNMVRAMGSLAMGMFGQNTIATTLPPGTLPTWGTNLRVSVPATQIYQVGSVDPNAWPSPTAPGPPISILTADAMQLVMQGLSLANINVALTGTPDAALSIGGGNLNYYLIQAKLNPSVDGNNFVLPYQSLLRTTVTSATDTTHLVVGSTTGMSQGDRISIPGFTFTGNITTTISSVTDATHIVLATALDSTTNIGNSALFDLNPAAGAPLNGPGNTGVAQPIDRTWGITFSVKAGVPAPAPTIPAADAGFVPMWLVGPLANGFTSSSGSTNIVTAVDGTGTPTAPFLPGIVGVSHHRGLPGHAAKVILTGAAETDYAPVNKAGDNMSGQLITTALSIQNPGIPAGSIIGTAINNLQARSNYNAAGNIEFSSGLSSWAAVLGDSGDDFSIWRARGVLGTPSYIQLFRILCSAAPTSDPNGSQITLDSLGFRLTRFATGTANHTQGSAEAVAVGFGPVIVILLNIAAAGPIVIIYGGSPANGCTIAPSGGNFAITEGVAQAGSLSSTGFTFSSANTVPTGNPYRWLAWG